MARARRSLDERIEEQKQVSSRSFEEIMQFLQGDASSESSEDVES